MLKNLMHSSNSRTDSSQISQSSYASARTVESAKSVSSAKAEAVDDTAKSLPADEGSKLIVGPNIKLKGSEITDCAILVVEGRVEASMKSRVIRIAEGGVFSGKAEIDVAEVHGNFEGELTARKRLVIHATGKVSGTIRYGAMMIEEGGAISGDVANLSGDAEATKASNASPQTPASEAGQSKTQEPAASATSASYFRNQVGRG